MNKQEKELFRKKNELAELRSIKESIRKEKEEMQKLINYEKAEKSLYEYHKLSWNLHVPQPFIDNWHVGAICDHLEALHRREIKNLIINVPARTGKSTLCSVSYPTWVWLDNPQEQFMTTSYNEGLVFRDATRSREIISSKWYQERWGERFQLKKDVNQKSRYENNLGGYRLASTIGGGTQLGEGYTTLLVDDPLKAGEAFSKIACSKVVDWWKNTMSTRANSPDAVRLIIMQRLSEMDLVEHILKENAEFEEWYHLCLPMRYEKNPKYFTRTPLKFVDPRTKEGELLCPKYINNTRVLVLERELGEYGTASQLQQRPAPVGGGIIKEDWLKTYANPISKYAYPHFFVYIFCAWDLNFGDENQNDGNSFCVGQVWGVGKDGKYYLLFQLRDKWTFIEQIKNIKLMNSLYPEIRYNIIEQMASGPGLINTIKKEAPRLSVIGIKPRDFNLGGNKNNTKILRVHSYLPTFENAHVWIPSKVFAPWVSDYVQELTTFPAAANDDQLDTTILALMWAEKKNIIKGVSIETVDEIKKIEKEKDFYSRRVMPASRFSQTTATGLTVFESQRNIF